jgi:hypothetical protein
MNAFHGRRKGLFGVHFPKKKSKKSVKEKRKEANNLYRVYPAKFQGLTKNPEKINETSNHPIKTKIFPKKTMFRTLKA